MRQTGVRDVRPSERGGSVCGRWWVVGAPRVGRLCAVGPRLDFCCIVAFVVFLSRDEFINENQEEQPCYIERC